MTNDPSRPVAAAADYVLNDWDRFRSLDYLINHWDRPGWTAGRRSYHWLLRVDHHLAVRQLAEQCQTALRHLPTLDLVPASSLHLTLQRIAFTDQLPANAVDRIAAAAAQHFARMSPIAIQVGPLAGSPGAVRFSAGPHHPIARIRNLARLATREGADITLPERATAFVPHVGIAYSNTRQPAAEIIDVVAALRSAGDRIVDVSTVDLVELRREGQAYAFQVLHSVPMRDTP